MFLFVVLSAGLLVIAFAAAGARRSNPDVRWTGRLIFLLVETFARKIAGGRL